MDRKTALFVATIGSVAVVVSLALTVSLWPEKSKSERRPNTNNTGSNASADNSAPGLATAAAAKKRNESPASAPKSYGMTDLSGGNTQGQMMVKTEVGKAWVRDPQTGEMKETTATWQVLPLMDGNGKAIQFKGKPQGLSGAVDAGAAPPSTVNPGEPARTGSKPK
jgi:hypothetical protein